MRCKKCNKLKSLQMFGKLKHRTDSICIKCRELKHLKGKEIPAHVYNKMSVAELKKLIMLCARYKISIKFYFELENKQKKKCAICRTHKKDLKFLVVDHCHVTGKVRALLCASCNTALGFVEKLKTENLLSTALDYLAGHS